MKNLLLVMMALSLSGCVPYLSTSTKSPALYGRVLDAATHAPLAGVHLAFIEKPSISCETDASGAFAIDATHNVHLMMMLSSCGADWPHGSYYTKLNIVRDGYVSRELNVYDPKLIESETPDPRERKYTLKDVLLEPVSKKPGASQSAEPTPKTSDTRDRGDALAV